MDLIKFYTDNTKKYKSFTKHPAFLFTHFAILQRSLLWGVTDLINRIVQVLKRDLYWVRISAQDIKLIKPVEPQDKGQPSHITSHKPHIKHTHVLTYSRTEYTDVPTYSTITIGRSYIFKHTVSTIKQFSSSQ